MYKTKPSNEKLTRKKNLCFSKPDGKGHVFRLSQRCDENSILKRKELLRIAGIRELSFKNRAEVLKMAETVAADAKAITLARNDYGNTKKVRDEEVVYDRVLQEYIEANDKFSFYTETVNCDSKVDGKPTVLKFARMLPICSCHVRTEDVTISTRTTEKGEETRYSLNADFLIYTPNQIWVNYLAKVVPIAALESPRDRGTGFTPVAAYYKQEYVTETVLHEQTLAAMNDLYSENLILAAHIEQLNDNISAQDTLLAYEQAKTAETKEQCAQELADLHTSLTEGSLKSLTLNYTAASNFLHNLISNTYYAFCRESDIKKIT